MLHLSFTQQLCHLKKIKQGEAANDASFGLSDVQKPTSGQHATAINRTIELPSAPYHALKQIAERYLKK